MREKLLRLGMSVIFVLLMIVVGLSYYQTQTGTGGASAAPVPVIISARPAPPICLLRNSVDLSARVLELTGQNFSTTDYNLQFLKVAIGGTSIHFHGEINWESTTRLTVDMSLIKNLLWSDPKLTLRARLTSGIDFSPVSDWSPEFVLADDALTCTLGNNTTPPSTRTISVYVMNFDPIVNGQALHSRWNDPTTLMAAFINDISQSSHGIVTYQIAKQSDIRTYPTKPGGFIFTDQQFQACLDTNGNSPRCADIIDYQAVLNTVYDSAYGSACNALANKGIDEIWLWGAPWMGYWEFYTITPNSLCGSVNKEFEVMGFSYERGVGEMLHDMGHRAEGALQTGLGLNLWDRFDGQRPRYGNSNLPDVDPNNAHCGNTHFPPNAKDAYAYSRNLPVQSDCADWPNYPNLTGQRTTTNYTTWCGPSGDCQRGFFNWWFSNFPHKPGVYNDTYLNWWLYLYPEPRPTITSLSPNILTAGDAGFMLTVNGTEFVNGGSVVVWNGTIRPTTFVSRTQLTAAIASADIASAGAANVVVFNSAPGGGLSNAQTITINPSTNPSPLVVTVASDTGQGNNFGTLSYALKQVKANQTITFKLPADSQNIIRVSGNLPGVPANITIQGGCNNGQPIITLAGTDAPAGTDGLTLGNSGITLQGLKVTGFKGLQIKATKPGNQLKCVVARK